MEERKEEPWKEEMEQWKRKRDDSDTFIPVIRLSAVREKEVRYSSQKVTTVEKAAELGRLLSGRCRPGMLCGVLHGHQDEAFKPGADCHRNGQRMPVKYAGGLQVCGDQQRRLSPGVPQPPFGGGRAQ